MAVSASTLKPVLNIGSFDVTTSLDIPSNALSNKFSFFLPTPIYPQLPNLEYSTSPVLPSVWTLAKVNFNGVEVFKNAQFDSPPAAAPSAPQSIISVSGVDGVDEAITDANPVSLVLGSDGIPASGSYQITLIYIYQDDNLDWYADEVVYPAFSVTIDQKTPNITFWYDTGVPTLVVTDSTNYTQSGLDLSVDTEFLLYPPLNEYIVEDILETQTITYSEFWTGANELEYTILVTLSKSAYEIVYLKQSYTPMLVYNLSRCEIYSCLKNLYDNWRACPCGTKRREILNDQIQEATVLAQLLVLGLGCSKDDYSSIINRFNQLLGSDCACIDSTPEFIS